MRGSTFPVIWTYLSWCPGSCGYRWRQVLSDLGMKLVANLVETKPSFLITAVLLRAAQVTRLVVCCMVGRIDQNLQPTALPYARRLWLRLNINHNVVRTDETAKPECNRYTKDWKSCILLCKSIRNFWMKLKMCMVFSHLLFTMV